MRIMLPIGFAMLMAACSGQNAEICETPPADGQGGIDGCIHRAAYQFARSPGTNTELARAVAAQCDKLILDMVTNGPIPISGEARPDMYDQSRKNAQEDALRRIVQAKAGSCDQPT